ncbi:MAG: hypothetical protein ABS43_24320 [Bordetella sp. SCN 67-23]|nr:MAG: hypothetical protein ABS43_24320 [Bordetella sp. SCN 67-23]ODU91663.1 MAG: hypothetical protein ABT00_06120 [Bordetella sp. SCN 68-11]
MATDSMQTYIKLVGSITPGGDHAGFFRWYCDHVNMLLRYPALRRAVLYRRSSSPSGQAPEYLCLYEFPSEAEFLEFSDSRQRKDASVVRENGWGKQGARVVQRSEYVRHARRTLPLAVGGKRDAVHEIHCLRLGATAPLDAVRWVDACLQGAFERESVAGMQVLRPDDCENVQAAAGEWLVVLERSVAPAAGEPPCSIDWRPVGVDEMPAPAEFQPRWTGLYHELCCWDR